MSSAEKVVHLNEEIHAKAKEHCAEIGSVMARWVEDLIMEAIKRHKKLDIYTKKVNRDPYVLDNEDNPWTKEPFWTDKN